MNIDLLTIGDCATDLFFKLDQDEAKILKSDGHNYLSLIYGSKTPVHEFHRSIAGNACNVAVSTNKMGMKTAIYTELGDDHESEEFIDEFVKEGISTKLCFQNPNTNTNKSAILFYGEDRTILSYHYKHQYRIDRLYESQLYPKWVYYSSLCEDFSKFQADLVTYIRQNPGIGVAFNPGSIHIKAGVGKLADILSVTDILFVNKDEAQQLTSINTTELKKLHKSLQLLGPHLTVITDGNKGSSAFDGENLEELGIIQNAVIKDKTGVGDAFAAGFLAAIFYGKDLSQALKWGTINSASVMSVVGSINGSCSKSKIEQELNKNIKFS